MDTIGSPRFKLDTEFQTGLDALGFSVYCSVPTCVPTKRTVEAGRLSIATACGHPIPGRICVRSAGMPVVGYNCLQRSAPWTRKKTPGAFGKLYVLAPSQEWP